MRARPTRMHATGALLAAMAMAAAGCGGSVAGQAEPASPSASSPSGSAPSTDGSGAQSAPPSTIDEPLTDLLVDPSTFPAPYQAVVLPQAAAEQAAADLGGVADGASVDPPGCKPTPRVSGADSVALIVGTDNATRSTISVGLTRVRDTLADATQLWEQCPEITTTSRGVDTSVSTEVVPAPPIDADDTAALRRTSASGSAAAAATSSTLTLLAQYGDVRVSVTFMTFEGAAPDTATLDLVFQEATSAVRAAA